MNLPGQPDRFVCHRYWQGWIEFKDERTTLKVIQAKRIEEMNERAPGIAYVVRFIGKDELQIEDWTGFVHCRVRNDALVLMRKLQELRACSITS